MYEQLNHWLQGQYPDASNMNNNNNNINLLLTSPIYGLIAHTKWFKGALSQGFCTLLVKVTLKL